MMRRFVVGFVIVASVVMPSYGQLIPDTAQVHLCFPQFADGGPVQTTFTFANSYGSAVPVTLYLMRDDGSPLTMDFGGGAGTQFSFSVPPRGTIILQSRAVSPTMISGWAEALSNLPIQGVVSYRFIQNGNSVVSAAATLPGIGYFSAATADTGIAVANASKTTAITLEITAHSNDGFTGSGIVTLAPRAKRAFILREVIKNLNPNFIGTVDIGGPNSPYPEFVALTLKAESGGIYSGLPSGALSLPVSQFERIWRVYRKVFDAARRYIPSPDTVQVSVKGDSVVNAFGNANGIQINLALAELISDSDSELAFVIGHELGHVYQGRTGQYKYNSDLEWDADIWGFVFSLGVGYDAYGAAGALAKLAMATGTANLSTQFELQNSSDAHKSFNERLANVYGTISFVCTGVSAEATLFCNQYRQIFHPHMPGGLLLTSEPE